MPQLHFSVDQATVDRIVERARQEGMSVSAYIASLVRGQLGEGWPEGYLDEVVGSCPDLSVPDELPLRPVDGLT